jgi:hypothetical protein
MAGARLSPIDRLSLVLTVNQRRREEQWLRGLRGASHQGTGLSSSPLNQQRLIKG